MTHEAVGESFADFKNSFSYGSRADHNFKFLKGLSDQEAALYLQELLWRLTESIDDGDVERLAELTLAWQSRSYAGASSWVYEDGPFVRPAKPVSEMRLALITSSGHFVDGDDPQPFGIENMTQDEASERIDDFLKEEPTLSAIPFDTPARKPARAPRRLRHSQRVGRPQRGLAADPPARTGGRRSHRRPAGQRLFVRGRVRSDASAATHRPQMGGPMARRRHRRSRSGAGLTGLPHVRGTCRPFVGRSRRPDCDHHGRPVQRSPGSHVVATRAGHAQPDGSPSGIAQRCRGATHGVAGSA